MANKLCCISSTGKQALRRKTDLAHKLYWTDCYGQQALLHPLRWLTSFDKTALTDKLYCTGGYGNVTILKVKVEGDGHCEKTTHIQLFLRVNWTECICLKMGESLCRLDETGKRRLRLRAGKPRLNEKDGTVTEKTRQGRKKRELTDKMRQDGKNKTRRKRRESDGKGETIRERWDWTRRQDWREKTRQWLKRREWTRKTRLDGEDETVTEKERLDRKWDWTGKTSLEEKILEKEDWKE